MFDTNTSNRQLVNRSAIEHVTKLTIRTITNQLDDFNEVLKHFDIFYFSLFKFIKNIRVIHLCNNINYLETFLNNLNKYHDNEFAEKNEVCLNRAHMIYSPHSPEFNISMPNNILMDQCMAGMKNSIAISIFDEITKATEIFTFYTNSANTDWLYKQLSHADELAAFILYFKDKAKSLLKEIALTEIDLKRHLRKQPNILDSLIEGKSSKLISENKNEIIINQYELGAPFIASLSPREFECLKMAYIGMTAKQIAKVLCLSFRTVEQYLANIRQKACGIEFYEIRQRLFHNHIFQLFIRKSNIGK